MIVVNGTLTRRSLLGTALTTSVLVGCTSGPPDGWQDVTVGHWKLLLPSTFVEASGAVSPWDKRFVDAAGTAIQVAGRFSDDTGSFAALARLDLPATLSLTGYTPDQTDTVNVDSAYDAVRRTYTFTDAGKTMRGAWLVASQWPYPSTAALSFSGAGLSDALVEQVRSRAKFITFKDGAK